MNDEGKRRVIKGLVMAMYESFRLKPEHEDYKYAIQDLVNELMDTQLDYEAIAGLIKMAKQKCRFCPVLADILQPMREEQTNKESSGVDECWVWFKSEAFNPVQKLPPWAYTIRKHIGASRLGSCTDRDLPFIEKQFRELMLKYIAKEIESQKDPGKWKKIGNSWALMPSGTSVSSPTSLKDMGIFKKQLLGTKNG